MTRSREPQPATDERKATIERLERALEAERQNAAALRKTVDELRFKLDVLEKGYGKQLADARASTARAEQEAAALRERWATIDADTSQALERLAAARAELKALALERDRWRELANGGAGVAGTARPPRAAAPVDSGSTINDLIAGIETLRTRPDPAAREAAAENAPQTLAANEPDAALEPMLDPALIFTKETRS